MSTRHYHRIFWLALFSFFVCVQPTQAFSFELFKGEQSSLNDFRTYIVNFYQFALPASVLVAVVLIMIAGIIWVTSAGSQSRISTAKEFIINAIIGIVLLMGAYIILGFINPRLVVLSLPEIKSITSPGCCLRTDSAEFVISKKACDDVSGEFIEGQTCEEVDFEKTQKLNERAEKRIENQRQLCTNNNAGHRLSCLGSALGVDYIKATPTLLAECSAFCEQLVPNLCHWNTVQTGTAQCTFGEFTCYCRYGN